MNILCFRFQLHAYFTRQAPAVDRRKQPRAVVGLHEGSCGSSGFGSLPLGSLGFLVSHVQLELQQLQFLPCLSQLCLCLIHLSLHASGSGFSCQGCSVSFCLSHL